MRTTVLMALCLSCLTGCAASEAAEADRLLELRTQVAALVDSVRAVYAEDATTLAITADSGDVVVRADLELLESMLRISTASYLDSVALHIEPNVEVQESGDVSKSLGLFSIPIGSWQVRVTIERIDATLHAAPIQLAVADSNRLDLRIPVLVRNATGQARVRFAWDASRVPGLLCGDFELDETFSGFVATTEYDLAGYFEFEIQENALVAIPHQTEDITVSPEPVPEAWTRVREVLDEKDGVLSCGLGLDPEDLERQLKRLLRRGFGFKLPGTILRPLAAPVGIQTMIQLNGRSHELRARPVGLSLTDAALQYSMDLDLVAPGTMPAEPSAVETPGDEKGRVLDGG